jgi:hypothetical protein
MITGYYVKKLSDKMVVVHRLGSEVLVSSDYRKVLAYLVEPVEGLRAVWNLAELVSVVKTVLPVERVEEMGKDSHRATWYDGGLRYRLFYQPGKFLGVNVNHNEVTFYELDQFYPDDRDVRGVWDVQEAADELEGVFRQMGVGEVKNLKSPVAVLEEDGLLDEFYGMLPDPGQIPSGCCEYAVQTGIQAWQTAYQVGYWDKAYGYDVASCYPGRAVRLYSLKGAKYEFSRRMIPATYGFVWGRMLVHPDFAHLSPLVSDVDGVWANPAGSFRDYFTLEQVRFVESSGIGGFDLEDGWFVTVQDGTRPFWDIMYRMYPLRSHGELMSQVVKRVIDGIIGRLGQYIQDRPTERTNPVYHSLIRTGAGVQVADFLMRHGVTKDELIHVNTDGCHLTRDIPVSNIVRGKPMMGEWRAEGADKLLVLSPGRVLEGDRCDGMVEAFKREKSATRYEVDGMEVDFMTLPTEQNRYFPKFPRTGGQVLRNRYGSESL